MRGINLSGFARLCACVFVFSILGPAISFADSIVYNYGDFPGSFVTFKDVTESAIAPAVPAHYGEPTVTSVPSASMDVLSFNVHDYSAYSIGGTTTGGVTVGDIELTTGIWSNSSSSPVDTISVTEAGDYCFTYATSTTGLTHVGVSGGVFLRISEVDGQAVVPFLTSVSNLTITADTPSYVTSPFNGVFVLNGTSDQQFQGWTGEYTFDVTALVTDAYNAGKIDRLGHATKVDLFFDNALSASSEAYTTALIRKKAVDIYVTSSQVPEPGTFALLCIGGLGLAGFALRRRRG